MSQPSKRATVCITVFAVVVALGLQGCRESEQGRVVFHKKGEYAGKADQKLTPEQLSALRMRTAGQQQ